MSRGIFAFNRDGDCPAATLRPGNVHSADGWEKVLLPVIDRYRTRGQTVVVRADAAFVLPAPHEALERRGVAYAIRLPANHIWSGPLKTFSPGHAADRAPPLVRYSSLPVSGGLLGPTATPRRRMAPYLYQFGRSRKIARHQSCGS